MDARLEQLERWLKETLGYHDYQIAPASSDASFRRYFRVTGCGEPVIVMDAPPERERCDQFVRVARAFAGLGIHVPRILEEQLKDGFLLLSDLGTRQYFTELSPENADLLYGDALDGVLRLQRGEITNALFPPYDRALLERELVIFREWFLDKYLHVVSQDVAVPELDAAFSLMVDAALEQPRVWVHRDYHSRNLMIVDQNNPGVLDFQDAVMGPITYDVVSLLRDCYIAWPRDRVERWALSFLERAGSLPAYQGVERDQFIRWMDWMGMQRHLKAIGIFARLNLRDGKPGYLKDIPRTFSYVLDVAGRYVEFAPFVKFLRDKVVPVLSVFEVRGAA